jgi:hypothetical protein
VIILFAKYNWSFQVEGGEMGGACNANGDDLMWVIGGKVRRKETTRKTKT